MFGFTSQIRQDPNHAICQWPCRYPRSLVNTRLPEADGTHRLGEITPADVSAVADALAEEDRGLEHRYDVKRVNDPIGKHANCRYFVLDPKHDPIARVALTAYAVEARAAGYTTLGDDLMALVKQTQTSEPENLLAVVENTRGDRYYRWSVEEGLIDAWRPITKGMKLGNTGGSTFSDLGEVRLISEGVEA
jgi:hypothetical protein